MKAYKLKSILIDCAYDGVEHIKFQNISCWATKELRAKDAFKILKNYLYSKDNEYKITFSFEDLDVLGNSFE